MKIGSFEVKKSELWRNSKEEKGNAMEVRAQKLSIRLLKEGKTPAESVGDKIDLTPWGELEGAQIHLETIGGNTPKWAGFLDLSDEEKNKLRNSSSCGLLFVPVEGRWFVLSFGLGHTKLQSSACESDFGLRVVLNAVDPAELKSVDVRTPDENTLSRRNQTSRGADYTAFIIDIERDIVRGIAGKPRDLAFASRLAGADALTVWKKLALNDISQFCADVYEMYNREDYKQSFDWIDYIQHIRDKDLIQTLDTILLDSLNNVLKGVATSDLELAFPVIYDPAQAGFIRYKGFRSTEQYPDLQFSNYIEALTTHDITELSSADLQKHTIHEVDDEGRDCGGKWRLYDCLVFQAKEKGQLYVLSAGLWYHIDNNFAKSVSDFFARTKLISLPEALSAESEEQYNARLKLDSSVTNLLCLDRKLVKPTGGTTSIEICDFLSRDKELIHIKHKNSSSRLSHLFNQGTVSGQILKMDAGAREKFKARISESELETEKTGFDSLMADIASFNASEFTIVYAVISGKRSLPFFSLVSFRQAAKLLESLDYKYAFAWIQN